MNSYELVQRFPVENQESPRTALALTRLVETGADAVQIADAIVSIWLAINVALSPIIGRGGLAMLYKRSIHLAGARHPWLAGTHEGAHTAMDLSILKSVLVQQGSAEAAAAGGTVLQTFHGLLATLIGPSLTETLLHSIWANAASDRPTAQDTAP